MRCRAGPCQMDFLHESCKICSCKFVRSHPICPSLKVHRWSRFRGCLKAEKECVKRICACSQEKLFCVRKSQMESCSHAVDLERYETGPEVPLLLLSFDAELAAGASTGVIAGEPHVLDPMVSRSPWGTVTSVFFKREFGVPPIIFIVLVQRLFENRRKNA